MQLGVTAELLSHTKEVFKIIGKKISPSGRNLYTYLLMENEDFEEHKIFYEDLENYLNIKRTNIRENFKPLQGLKLLTKEHRTSTNKTGNLKPNIMFIRLHSLYEIRESNKKLTI